MPDIVITPNRGTSNNPKIDFTGTSAGTIKLEVLADGAIAWNGANGSLFSIADSLSGSLMSVNDISGLPAFEVFSDNRVIVGQFGANLLLGTTTNSSNGRLQLATHTTVAGGIGFGTDIGLYRLASNKLSFRGTANAEMSLRFERTGGSFTTTWENYIPVGSTDLKWFNGADKFTLTASGNATFSGTATATQLISNASQGTAPLVVSSSTQVSNLNAQYLNGYSSDTANNANTIVRRDGSGNFSAGTITASNISSTTLTQGGTAGHIIKEYSFNLNAQSSSQFFPIRFTNVPLGAGQIHSIEVLMDSFSGGDPYNHHSVHGQVRGSGWTDLPAFYDIFHNCYQDAERSYLGFFKGTQNCTDVILYVRGGKTYYVKTPSTASVSTTALTISDSVFAIKDSNAADVSGTSANISFMLNLITASQGRQISSNIVVSGSISGSSFAAGGNTVWHAGNDGSGSGLDADLLDGYNQDTANTASAIVRRDGSGFINATAIQTSSGGSNGVRVHTNSGITASNNYMNFFTSQTSGWAFNANGTGADTNNVAVVTSGGNVGIGQTSPLQTLQLKNNGWIGIGASTGSYIPTSWQRGGNGGIILSSSTNADGSGWSYGSRLVQVDYGNGLGLSIDVNYASSWTNDALFISGRSTSLGNVGIGTTDPAAKLDVNGSFKHGLVYRYPHSQIAPALNSTGWLKLATIPNNSRAKFLMRNGSANSEEVLDFDVYSTYYNSGVYVTINRNTYNYHLSEIQVQGADGQPRIVYVKCRTSDYSPTFTWQVESWNGAATIHNTEETPTSGKNFVIGTTNYLHSNYVPNVYFDGSVGIGKIPSTKFNIKEQNTGTEGFIIANWNNVNTVLVGSDASTGGGKFTLKNNSGTANVFINSAGDSYLNGGNFAVGNTSAAAKFDVQSAITGAYASSTQQTVARFFNSPAALGSGNNSSFISLQTTADGGSSNPIARLGVVGETYGSNAGAFVVATRSGSDNLIYERFRVDSNGYLSTPTGSQLSYQDATTFTIWSSEAEYSVVDDNGDSSYKVMKSFIAEKSGSLRVKFSAYIQSGTYYWAWRIRKANSTVLASGNYQSTDPLAGLDAGQVSSVHAYRRFSALISVNPGDVITVEMVSSDGSGNPVAGNSQTLYLKELRIYSSVTSGTHGSLNVFGDYVGIGTWTPKARLEVRPPTSVLYSSTIPYQPTTAAILSPVMPAASTDTYTSILQLVSIRQALVAGRYAHGYLGFSTVDNSNLDGVLDAGRISIKNDDGVGLYSATSMGFWTNPGGGASTAAIERVRISSSGNVGIATTDPAYRLQLGTHFSGTQTQTSMFINAGGATTAGAIFISPDGNSSVGAKIGQYFESPANIQRLDLGTVGYSGVYPTVSIKEGKMGIGTTSPGYKLEVTGDAYITEALKQGNVETRSFAVTFSDGVANRATDIRFPNTYINGLIEVEVTSSYSNQNSVGVVKKIFSVGANPTNSIWNTTVARVVEAHGVAADNWTIGDFAWDATNSKYIIPVYHIVSSGNVLNINIRYFSQAAVSSPVLPTTTVSAQYTATIPAAYQTRHYVYYNDRLGIGTSAPSTMFQVASTGTGNFRLDTNGSGGHYYQGESNARLGIGRDLVTSAGHITFTMAGGSPATVGSAITMPAHSQLGFYTSNGTNLTQRVVIDGNGNVGIGAPAPDHKLHVIGAIRYNSNSNPITEYAGAVDGPDGYPACTDNARIYTIGTINADASYNGYIEIEVIGSHRGYTVDSYYEYAKWILTVGDRVSSRLVFSSGSLRVGLWNGTDASGYLGNTGGINAINLALRLIINPSCGAGRRYTVKVKYADINLTHGPFTYTTHTSLNVTVPYSQYHIYGDNAIIGNETGNVYIRPNGNPSVGIGTGSAAYNLELAKASAGATFAVNADTAAAGEASVIAFTSRQYNTYYKAAIIAYDPHGGSWNRRGLALCVNNATDGSSATYAAHKALYIAPDKNSTFYGDVTVAGALTVQDGTASTNVFGLTTFTKSLTVTTSWSDVGISGADLATGSYIIQVTVDNYDVSGGQYAEYYTGFMSWVAGGTNSTDVDEIVLHKAGHAPNGNWINLRTVRQLGSGAGVLKLQIIASGNTSAADNYVFKFRRMI